MRNDKFEVGDSVTFIPTDDYTSDAVQQGHWREHGRGPYTVEEVEDLERWQFENPDQQPAHSQYVTVNGERFSGYWFNPVR